MRHVGRCHATGSAAGALWMAEGQLGWAAAAARSVSERNAPSASTSGGHVGFLSTSLAAAGLSSKTRINAAGKALTPASATRQSTCPTPGGSGSHPARALQLGAASFASSADWSSTVSPESPLVGRGGKGRAHPAAPRARSDISGSGLLAARRTAGGGYNGALTAAGFFMTWAAAAAAHGPRVGRVRSR